MNFRDTWFGKGRDLVANCIQGQSAGKYAQKFSWWTTFVELSGYRDPILRDMPEHQLTLFICAFAAWARSDGRWGGDTVIQGLSAVRHTFKCNFRDYSAFRSDLVASARTTLRVSDMFDEARRNREDRLPYTMEMMQTSRDRALASDDPKLIMVITAMMTSQMVLLRISEYGQAPGKRSPDHRMRTTNVVIYVKGRADAMSTTDFHRYARTHNEEDADKLVETICITVPGSKTDKKRAGITFAFEAEDFDLEDKTNSISMWVRWIMLANPAQGELLFALRQPESGELLAMSQDMVSTELRAVGRLYGIREDQLYRLAPHSVRIGMGTHCHNIGLSDNMVEKMGRWAKGSTSAPKYQRMGAGVCKAIADAVSRKNILKGQTTANLLKTTIRATGWRDQYKPTLIKKERGENPRQVEPREPTLTRACDTRDGTKPRQRASHVTDSRDDRRKISGTSWRANGLPKR